MNAVNLSTNQINDGFFVRNGNDDASYTWPSDKGGSFQFVGTYHKSGSPIRDALLTMIRSAKRRVFVASFVIGDEAILTELLRAAERLRGGVYVITKFDEAALRKGLAAPAKVDDDEQESPEERLKDFSRLTSNGVYVRGHESCHAKFAVVDDEWAIAGSANFVSRGFEWTGEANVVIREPTQVRQMARLFTQLWFDSCKWEVPPGETYYVAQRPPATPPARPETPDWRSHGVVWTNGADETFLHKCICDVIMHAHQHLTLASYSIVGMNEKPHLLLEPLRDVIGRGVPVRCFVRQQNPSKSQRADLCRLYDMGVRIYGDRRNHAKGVIADGVRGALFSCNFDGQFGLDSGVEVGVRLDGHTALSDLERYFDHVIQHADARYLRNPTLGELDGKLAAGWCKPWPLTQEIQLNCTRDIAVRFTEQSKEGPVLYEKHPGELILHAGDTSLRLRQLSESVAECVEMNSADVIARERLESWLASVRRQKGREIVPDRGFCPARIEFSH